VIETYRMLGKEREEELLREARRLQAGEAARRVTRRRRGRRVATLLRSRLAFGKLRTAIPHLASVGGSSLPSSEELRDDRGAAAFGVIPADGPDGGP